MAFTSPIWLVGLIPWSVVLLWLLRGRRQRTGVPFLELWRSEEARRRPRKSLEMPPMAIVAAMVAVLLAILSASGPSLSIRRNSPQNISIIVDRGLTMSAANAQGKPRFVEAAEMLDARLRSAGINASVRLTIVPGQEIINSDTSRWLQWVEPVSPTGMTDDLAVASAARRAAEGANGPVIVLSDRYLELKNAGLLQIAPDSPLINVGIESFSARIDPRPAAMVRIFNQSPLTSAMLSVGPPRREIVASIELPPRGERRDYFVDLPDSAEVIGAQVSANDNPALNHRAWLVRQSAWPRIEARSSLPAEVQRMIEIYSRRRPPSEGSRAVAVLNAAGAMPADESAVVLAEESANWKPVASAEVAVADTGPVIGGIDWRAALRHAEAAAPPPGNWTPVVFAAGAPVVAIREQPRQVWIGFRDPDFARTSDFVVFWSRVFDWLAAGPPVYASEPIAPLEGNWRLMDAGVPAAGDFPWVPGVYQSPEGAKRALNASSPVIKPNIAADWRPQLSNLLNQSSRRPYPLGSWVLIAALTILCLAGAIWRRREFGQS